MKTKKDNKLNKRIKIDEHWLQEKRKLNRPLTYDDIFGDEKPNRDLIYKECDSVYCICKYCGSDMYSYYDKLEKDRKDYSIYDGFIPHDLAKKVVECPLVCQGCSSLNRYIIVNRDENNNCEIRVIGKD